MAGRDVFLDTSGLYALVDKRDAYHGDARTVIAKLARAGRKFIVTDYIVDEAATLAKMRGGAHVARRILDLVEQSAGIRVEWMDADRFDATKAYFRKHADHEYSFTDCASFVVMRQLRLREAVTTDGHFVAAGFLALLPVQTDP